MKTTEFTTKQEIASAKAESRLAIVSTWLFTLGLIAAGALLALCIYNFMIYEEELALQQLIISFGIALLSIIIWAIFGVLCGISYNLRMLNSKTQEGGS